MPLLLLPLFSLFHYHFDAISLSDIIDYFLSIVSLFIRYAFIFIIIISLLFAVTLIFHFFTLLFLAAIV
jgi:hypothetical protein